MSTQRNDPWPYQHIAEGPGRSFLANLSDASYAFADDTGGEWNFGYRAVERAARIAIDAGWRVPEVRTLINDHRGLVSFDTMLDKMLQLLYTEEPTMTLPAHKFNVNDVVYYDDGPLARQAVTVVAIVFERHSSDPTADPQVLYFCEWMANGVLQRAHIAEAQLTAERLSLKDAQNIITKAAGGA